MITTEQWKLLGQERDGCILLGWVQSDGKPLDDSNSFTVLGCYDRLNDKLKILHSFTDMHNIVQATINQTHTLLGYVIKNQASNPEIKNLQSKEDDHCGDSSNSDTYETFIIELKSNRNKTHDLGIKRDKQIRIQFLYKEKEKNNLDVFILLIHRECILKYTATIDCSINDDLQIIELKSESIVKTFIWAQWDMINQVLYHIHHRQVPVNLITEEETETSKPMRSNPTLSGLQFHDDLPHETVLNIPLNLPQLTASSNCGTYEDDVIPLRVHDCSLDLIVVSDSKGMVCVCHHYLYRPVEPPQTILNSLNDSNTVHFAYSVTLLHHSCVIHCVIPGIPWSRAKLIRPTFAIYENDHMIIFVQDMFIHLLEIGANHEPRCHILCGPLTTLPLNSSYLVSLLDLDNIDKGAYKKHESAMANNNSDNKTSFKDASEPSTVTNTSILTIDLPTLDLVPLSISSDFLIDVFRTEISVEVRLGILHYFLCHRHDMDIIADLISIVAEKPRQLDIVRYMQEILIGGSYSTIQKNLLADAVPLLALMPVTTMEEYTNYEVKVNNLNITLSHEKLWNTSVMLLSPQQRLVPYKTDLWTKLWDQLSKNNGDKPRFKTNRLAEKLLVSLGCYEPEALSRCSTPMSPSAGFSAAMSFGDVMGARNRLLDSSLPFAEVESCTASKQEHVVSVNLRELSMYLLKHGVHPSSSFIKGTCTPLHVHTMATRHVTAQLEISRLLCQFLCRAANVDPRLEQEQGFMLIEQLDIGRRWLLFVLLERYRFSLESIAFPAPQGFTSFFTYLGYRTLKYSMFLQYVQRNVFELQVDVSKIIMADIGDSKENIAKKLALLSLLPKARAKRLLNQWLHPVSFMLRAREHAENILSGQVISSRVRISKHRNHYNALTAFPSSDRLSPLDTFLDLLTAKASLAELDFGLLIDATVTSTEDFL
ncbi:protein pigeon isoform X2 [Prorops nasuta]|uniref:protein pigeon isoform X2 n=1 Tax=Prorops nasuta TaxID=863751 RepID=UPI0034CF3A39